MRVAKKTPNQDDFRVLLVGLICTLFLFFVIAPVINKTCGVTETGSITFTPFNLEQESP